MYRDLQSIALLTLLTWLAAFSTASAYGPATTDRSLDQLKTDINGSLDLGNLNVEQTAVTIAKDYPGEYNLNQVSEVYNSLQKGWYYYSDPSYKDKYKSANRTLQDGKISNSIGMGHCDDFAILMASLLESLQGSTRIVFAYDQDTRLNHAYAEVYLGKKSDPRVDELIGWIKDQYNQTEISGQAITGDEVWLNLDYNSTYPGGRYFGEGHRIVREVVWKSASRNSPKIIPIIETMDNTTDWREVGDEKGSILSISSVPSLKGKAIQMNFDLKDGGWVGISRNVSGSMLSQVRGLNFSYSGLDRQIAIELILVNEDNSSFGYSWEPEPSDKWAGLEALFEDFTLQGSSSGSGSDGRRLDPSKTEKLEIVCRLDENATPSTGRIILDHVRGVMNVPPGSIWALAEAERETAVARDLAAQSELALNDPSRLIESVKLAVQSLSHKETLEGDLAIRHGLNLLPVCLIQLQHNASVSHVAFSHDGARLAANCLDGTACIWDLNSRRKICVGDVWADIAFSPNGTMLATGGKDNTARIWDVKIGQELKRFECDVVVSRVSFSPDERKLAAILLDGSARIWDLQSEQEIYYRGYSMTDIAFSPDGTMMATASFNNTRICDAQTGKELIILDCSDSDATSHFISSLNGTSKSQGVPRSAWSCAASHVRFSPDGTKLATANLFSPSISLWDVKSGKRIHKLEHDGREGSIAEHVMEFSPDGTKIATGSYDDTARLWDVQTGREMHRLRHDSDVSAIAFSPDGTKLASGSVDKTVRIWNVKTGKEMQRFDNDAGVSTIAFSPNGTEIAVGCGEDPHSLSYPDNTVRIWGLQTQDIPQKLEDNANVKLAIFSPDGTKLATASFGGSRNVSSIWDVQTGRKIREIEHNDSVVALAFSPDSTKLATGCRDKMARIWDVNTGREVQKQTHNGAVEVVVFGPEGTKVLTGSDDNTVCIWDVLTGQEFHKLTLEDLVQAAAFSSDGTAILTATRSHGDTARIWDVLTGQELQELHMLLDDFILGALAFSPDGTRIAIGNRSNILSIWDVQTGKIIQEIEHEGLIRAIVFSPDGTRLATGIRDETACIWDIQSGEEIQRLEHEDYVNSIAFSPNGDKVATSSWNTVFIWTLRSQDLICEACSRIGCNLTSPEWRAKYCSKCNESNAYLAG